MKIAILIFSFLMLLIWGILMWTAIFKWGLFENPPIPDDKKMPNLPIITDNRGCEYYVQENGNYIHIGRCSNPLHYFKDNNTYKYVISLPEEYPLLSSVKDKPDTLLGYISRDTLYIGFYKSKFGNVKN